MVSTSRWKPYPAYKPSGIEWLGEIPEEWKTKRLKFVSRVNMGQSPPSELCNDGGDGLPFLQGNAEFGVMFPDARHYCPLPPKKSVVGDLLLSVRAPVGALNVSDQVYGIGRGLCAITPNTKDVYSVFSRYLIQVVREELNTVATGSTYEAVSASEVGDLTAILPPLPEQQAIASFLDRQTAKIDELIANKQQLIELLEEKCTAVISHAVTKGLEANVKTKPPGIPWLGDIPEHWEVLPLKRRSKRIQTGSTPPTKKEHYYENGSIPWFGPGSFGKELILEEPIKYISDSAISDGSARLFENRSVMIVGIGATIGKVGMLSQDSSCNQQITGVTFDDLRIYPKFGAYQLKSFELVLRGIAPSSTLPILDQGKIGMLPITLPPLKEQQMIVEFLDDETSKIDTLIAKVREGIEKLTEYRTVLISAAVTGKIDVREAV